MKRLNRWHSSNMEGTYSEAINRILNSTAYVINRYAQKDCFLRVKNLYDPQAGGLLIDVVNLKSLKAWVDKAEDGTS